MAMGKILTFDDTERLGFEALWKQGRQREAIEYASTVFADRALFLYGNANHPVGWGSTYGVAFGQFGTWPVQYLDWMMKGLSRGTFKDRAEFAAWNLAAPWALVATGKQGGVDFNAWWGISSLGYSGGPYLDLGIDVVKAYSGSPTERAFARANLRRANPLRQPIPNVLVPVSFAIDDVADILTGKKSPISLVVSELRD
jgi:hypothetical protein